MIRNIKLFNSKISTYRNFLGYVVILGGIFSILFISWFYFKNTEESRESADRIFTMLIPLFATWIGTVLAFYFGRENFESATNRYEKIIDKLSPDLLDDINVGQIMISKKTMVYKDISEIIGEDKVLTISDLIEFLNSVKKSRLPILENNKIKYIIHKSTFLSALNNLGDASITELNFNTFLESNEDVAISFLEFREPVILEDIRSELAKDTSIKDVFINNSQGEVIGWLPDTLMMRYLNSSSRTNLEY